MPPWDSTLVISHSIATMAQPASSPRAMAQLPSWLSRKPIPMPRKIRMLDSASVTRS